LLVDPPIEPESDDEPELQDAGTTPIVETVTDFEPPTMSHWVPRRR
jgi:hypothetical protein